MAVLKISMMPIMLFSAPKLLKLWLAVGIKLLVFPIASFAWTQVGSDIDGRQDGENFGIAVDINADGSRIIIGAPRYDDGASVNIGRVNIFEYESGQWALLGQELLGESAIDLSGISVSINELGDRVAIGATGNDGNGGSGHVRVFDYSSSAFEKITTH